MMVSGARLSTSLLQPSLVGRNFTVPPADKEFSRQIRSLLPRGGSGVGIAILDITNPARPVYASVNDGRRFIPASTGKVLVALSLLQTLADVYGPDVAKREAVLREYDGDCG